VNRVAINPDLLTWARERAGLEIADLEGRFTKLADWEVGEAAPTLKQVEAFAKAVHVPVGYLFLSEPPAERVPIPDFRTFAGHAVKRPSPNLLDTIYSCQERQGWYREFAQITHLPELKFVGSAALDTPPERVAGEMRATLGFDLETRKACPSWSEALRLFMQQADRTGVLVMVSGVVLSNNRRRLNTDEFRGFALSDKLAPLIFINGADTKAAQMFTLAHELAHLWLDASALSNMGAAPTSGFRKEEVWCNKVAAELLAPLEAVRAELRDDESLADALGRLAKQFKVSTLVILRRLLDAGWLNRKQFDEAWSHELARLRAITKDGAGGGDFYRTTLSRVSRRFARALVVSTLEGQTLYRDAFRMLGVSKTETFHNLGREVGVLP
jgi:Zn-dependent peptidase ImmA (M78 family)